MMSKRLVGQQEEVQEIPRLTIIKWCGLFIFGLLAVSFLYNQATAVMPKAPPQPKAAVVIPNELQNIAPLSESDKSEIDSIAQTEIPLYFERSGSVRSNKPYEVLHTGQEIADNGSLGTKTLGILRKINYDVAQIKWYYYNSGNVEGEPFEMYMTLKKETQGSPWKYYDPEDIGKASP